jgi:penicillin-binding protein 1A
VAEFAHQAGIESPLTSGGNGSKKFIPPSIAIGAQAVTPLDLANGYATIASGKLGNPLFVEGIRKGTGNEEIVHSDIAESDISTAVLGMLTYSLQGVVNEPEGTAYHTLHGKLGDWAVAGKTGTTNASRDAWFAGCAADEMCTVTWIGSRVGTLGKRVYGGNSAAVAWLPPMLEWLKGKKPRSFPYPLYTPPEEQVAPPTTPDGGGGGAPSEAPPPSPVTGETESDSSDEEDEDT